MNIVFFVIIDKISNHNQLLRISCMTKERIFLFIKKKIHLLILSLIFITAATACSAKPSKDEFDKFVKVYMEN